MRYFFRSFMLALGDTVRLPRDLIACAVLPLLAALFLLAVPSDELAAPVRVGVVSECEGDSLSPLLEEYSGVISFVPAERETMEREVAVSRWDCGIIIPEDFAERVSELDTERLLTLVTGPGSTAYPIVREAVSACLARLIAPGMAGDYMESAGIVPSGIESGAERVDVIVVTAEGAPSEPGKLAESVWSRLAMAALSAAAAVYVLLISCDVGLRYCGSAGRIERRLRPGTLVLLPRVLAPLVPLAAAVALSALILSDFTLMAPLAELLALLASLSLLVSRIKGAPAALPVLVPFVPVVAFLCAFLPRTWLLLPAAGVLLVLSLLCDVRIRRRA